MKLMNCNSLGDIFECVSFHHFFPSKRGYNRVVVVVVSINTSKKKLHCKTEEVPCALDYCLTYTFNIRVLVQSGVLSQHTDSLNLKL